MGKIERGRLTISTNTILTASLITRTLTFGYVMLSIYIKVGDDILDKNVMKMMNIEKVFGMPLGSTVQSIVFSLLGVFVLEFVAGAIGLIGAMGKKKIFLIIAMVMSFLMMIIYTVYIVLLSLIYHETDSLFNTMNQYSNAYSSGSSYMSTEYYWTVYPGFLSELGCGFSYSEYSVCYGVYKEQVRTYLQIYFGIIITCFLCHVVSIVAVEYTYRKLEFKEKCFKISTNKYFLLLTIRHGIGRTFIRFVRNNWRKSKVIFLSVILRIVSVVVHIGLLGLGLTLCGDVFITDSSLKHIFYQLKFYQYNFYDILIGLAASAVVIGLLGAVISIISLVGTRKKCPKLIITACLSSTIMFIPRIIVVVIWAVFIDEINDEMRPQLRIQQKGYYISSTVNRITGAWNYMIMTLDCCGVDYSYDTFTSSYGSSFCCKNSHESRLNPFGTYVNVNPELNYFGNCGGYRTNTCSGKILSKSRMYIGWFLGIVLFQIVTEVIVVFLLNREYFISHHQKDSEELQPRCTRICLPVFIIYRNVASGIKARYFKRSKAKIVYFVSLCAIMILSICLLSVAINIRYDTVFGNGDIEELLRRIHITDTNFNKAIENFSTVVSTFSVTAICIVIYSILVPEKCKQVFVIVGLCLWVMISVSHVIEIGLWSKFLQEVNSSVTYQLAIDLNSYSYSDQSERHHPFSFYWNTLFVKARCCGVVDPKASFTGATWYSNGQRGSDQIPVQCCTSQTEVYPYDSTNDDSCTNTPMNYHTQGCDAVIKERLQNNYSIPFFVFTTLILVAEVLCIIMSVLSLIRKTAKGETIRLIDVHSGEKKPELTTENNDKTEVKTIPKTEGKKSKRSKNSLPAKTKEQQKKEGEAKSEKENTEETTMTSIGAKKGDKGISEKTKGDKDKDAENVTSNDLDITDFNESNGVNSVVQTNDTEPHSVDVDRQTSSSYKDKRKSVDIKSQSSSSIKDKRKSIDIERQSITSNFGKRQSVDSGKQTPKGHLDKRQSIDSGQNIPNSYLSKRQSVDSGKQTPKSHLDKRQSIDSGKQSPNSYLSKRESPKTLSTKKQTTESMTSMDKYRRYSQRSESSTGS